MQGSRVKLNPLDTIAANAGAADARTLFYRVFAVTLLLKLWLAATFPMTGDEAFFYHWGVYPDWGFYDHPPMVGWLLYVLSRISNEPLVLRSVTVMLWSGIALGVVDLLRRLLPERTEVAYRTGSMFLVLPFTWALNLVTTDTPLILFVFLSGYSFVRARLEAQWRWYAVSGIFLGLAFLSKYFAVLLAGAYFVFLIRSRRDWPKLAVIALCALPFVAENIWYNSTHCWNNVMFNAFNRNEGARWSLGTIVLYLGMMIYLITPWVFVGLVRARQAFGRLDFLAMLFLVPFLFMLVLSTRKTVGLHWVLGFMPFVFLLIGAVSDVDTLRRYFRLTVWFSLPHLLALAAVVVLPVSVWKGSRLYDDMVFHKKTPEIVAALRVGLPDNGLVMARAYTPASILSYYAGEYWPVFGEGRFHARQDDVLVDFRQYAGRPIRIFDKRPIALEEVAPYFEKVSAGSFEVAGVTYWFADGEKFDYVRYREQVLKRIAERYYRIPAFLPVLDCAFLKRYDFPCR